MNRRTKRSEYRPHNLGNSNAARKAGTALLLTIDGQQIAGIDRATGRLLFASADVFPFVFNSTQATKAFIRKAVRLGHNFSPDAVSVTQLASSN